MSGGGGDTKAAENKASTLTDQQMKDQKGVLDSTSPTENYYMGSGDPKSTGLYKSLLTTGLESTSDAYQGAKASTKANEEKSGYGYGSPASEGADREVNAAEAHDLAGVPNKATLGAVGPQLQATGMKQSQAGYYTPSTYFGDQANLAQAYDKQKSSLWQSIAGIGANVADNFIP